MRTVIHNTLLLLILAGLAPAQTVPALWDRDADWVVPPLAAAGTTQGNPAPDSVGNLVWNYSWRSFTNTATPDKYWALWQPNVATRMVWDDAFFGGAGRWVNVDDGSTYVSQGIHYDNYSQFVNSAPWRIKPYVEWENTTGQALVLDIVGDLTVQWHGAGFVNDVLATTCIFHFDTSTGIKTPLYLNYANKPSPASGLVETLTLPPVNVLGVSIAPGDYLVISNAAIGSNGGWLFFDDSGLDFIVSAAVSYCTAGLSANGCQATLSAGGIPSAANPSGFVLSAATVEGAKDGLFFFGANGRQTNAWGNGTSFQCVVPPVKRAGLLPGSGTAGLCDGAFSQDFNALWTAKPAQNPGAGAVVQAQLWYRDPFNTSNQTTGLSDALEFTVGP